MPQTREWLQIKKGELLKAISKFDWDEADRIVNDVRDKGLEKEAKELSATYNATGNTHYE